MPSRYLGEWVLGALASLFVLVETGAAQPPRGFEDWTESGFPEAESRMLEAGEIYPRRRTDLPYRLDATVLYLRGTPWTEARALRQIRRTAAIFEPCGIMLRNVRLARLRLHHDGRRIDADAPDRGSGVPPQVARLAAMLPTGATYPVAFLIGRVDGSKSLAVSYRAREPDGSQAPYFNTAWIGYQAHWLPRRDDMYSPLAHEFAHLLCRCGHVSAEQRHLLHNARNFLSSYVLPEHCELFRSSPLLFVSSSQFGFFGGLRSL